MLSDNRMLAGEKVPGGIVVYNQTVKSPLSDLISNLDSPSHYQLDVVEPASGFEGTQPAGVVDHGETDVLDLGGVG